MTKPNGHAFSRYVGAWIVVALAPTAFAESWCADPRPNEPLLIEGIELATSLDMAPTVRREILGIPIVDKESVAIVEEESLCRLASKHYWSKLRDFVPYLFGDHDDDEVLVVKVGSVYLVDDMRQRGTYWQVMIFESDWKYLYSYGEGA